MTKTYIDELVEEIAKLREENKRLKEENRALAMGSFPLMIEGANKIEKLKELLKECNKTFFEIRLSLSSGKINSVFDLSYQRENDINEALKWTYMYQQTSIELA